MYVCIYIYMYICIYCNLIYIILLRTDDVKVISECLFESIIIIFLCILAFPTKENESLEIP